MSLLILIHKTKAEDARNTSIRLFEQFKDQCQWQTYVRSNGQFIDVGPSITIVFRSGEDPAKVAGLRPDYYYSDSVIVTDWIAQAASKIGGKQIYEVDRVLSIVLLYMMADKWVDEFLDVVEE